MDGNIIKSIEIKNLWGNYNLRWDTLNPDVNILVGINGSGKTTVLKIISEMLSEAPHQLSDFGNNLGVTIIFDDNLSIEADRVPVTDKEGEYISSYIIISDEKTVNNVLLSTFDTPIRDKERLKQNESSLDQELDFLIYQRDKNNPVNFTNYRLKATMPKYNSAEIAGSIKHFFENIINPLFSKTEKKIEIDESSNEVIFRTNKGNIIKLSDLSSGEKQMLIILFRLFLMEKQRYIVLMDEPEVSLHIEWQQKLISVMQEVNPNCQFIISTHSPSIFGQGWMDKLQHIENLKTD